MGVIEFRSPEMTKRSHRPEPANTERRPWRVAFLIVMPAPYVRDMFAAIKQDGRIDPRVFYLAMSVPGASWGHIDLPDYSHVLKGCGVPLLKGLVHVNPGAIRRLRAAAPDLVVDGGYSSLTNQAVMSWLRACDIPWVFWGESPGIQSRGLVGSWLRWLAQRPAVRWPDGIAAVGSVAVSAYQRLAADHCVIRSIPYYCELGPFLDTPRRRSPDGSVNFLFCGQLIKRKGVDLLLEAFCRLSGEFEQARLTLVGAGELQSELQRRIPPGLESRIKFDGFRAPESLVEAFGSADVFVLPSMHDGWGVVVNQAVAAGLPVIASSAVGAAADLVVEDGNGHIFAAGNVEQLTEAMRSFLRQPEKIARFGARSRALAVDWTPQRGVDQWVELCEAVFASRRGLSGNNAQDACTGK